MLRVLALLGALIAVAGCQTGSADTAAALSSAASTDEAVSDSENQENPDGESTTSNEGEEVENSELAPANENAEAAATSSQSSNADPVVAGVRSIASVRTNDGEPAAVLAVFNCYKKARERSVSLTGARICAAQDFVVSREVISNRPATATGTNDRALLVSKRHAERIGALMKLKGMNQSQFNSFGAYLHAVAEPEYEKARQL